MPKEPKTLIMKFGGASVQTVEGFSHIADLIAAQVKNYSKIAVVVSAMGGMTDHLISLATQVNPHPPRREYDMLLSVGERISIALLAMALSQKNIEAVSFTGSQSGILTTSEHTEAKILDVRPQRLLKVLAEGKIAIVAGFQGMSLEKEITTLGRGGSDTTAVALGLALGAEKVVFYKDVLGIYQEDPRSHSEPTFCPHLSFEEALQIVEKTGGKILHPRALRLAQKNSLQLHVRSFVDCMHEGSYVYSSETSLSPISYEI